MLENVPLKLGNHDYFAFVPQCLKNDGTFTFWHERFNMPEHVSREEITPEFVDKEFFGLNNDFTKQNGGFAKLKILRNTILIRKIPVWNNTVCLGMFYKTEMTEQTVLSGSVNGVPFEFKVDSTTQDCMGRTKFYEFHFRTNGVLTVYANDVEIAEFNLGYTSLTAIDNVRIGDGERADASLYYFCVSNWPHSQSYLFDRRMFFSLYSLLKDRGLEKDSFNIPQTDNFVSSFSGYLFIPEDPSLSFNSVNGWGNYDNKLTSFTFNSLNLGNYWIEGSYLNKSYLDSNSTSIIKFINKEAIDENKYLCPKVIDTHGFPVWRFSPKQRVEVTLTGKEKSFGISFTALQEIEDDYRILDYVSQNGDVFLSIYRNRIRFVNNNNQEIVYNINSLYCNIYLRPYNIFITEYYNSPQNANIRRRELRIYLNENLALTLHNPPNLGGSIVKFNGGEDWDGILCDVHAINRPAHTEGDYGMNYVRFNEQSEKFVNQIPYVLNFVKYKNAHPNTYSSDYHQNRFDNIDSDFVIQSVNGAANAIFTRKDWNSIGEYIPRPPEFETDEEYIQYMDKLKSWIPRKIKTRKLTQQEDENYESLFDICKNHNTPNVDHVAAMYVEYHPSGQKVDEKDRIIFARHSENGKPLFYAGNYVWGGLHTNGSITRQVIPVTNFSDELYKSCLSPVMINFSGQWYVLNNKFVLETYFHKPPTLGILQEAIVIISSQQTQNNLVIKPFDNPYYRNICYKIGGYSSNPEWINHYSFFSKGGLSFFNYQESMAFLSHELKSVYLNRIDCKLTNFEMRNVGEYGNIDSSEMYPSNFNDTSTNPFKNVSRFFNVYDLYNEQEDLEIPKYNFNELIISNLPDGFDGTIIKDSMEYKIYGKVQYDGKPKENMRMLLVSNNQKEDNVFNKVQEQYTNDRGYYEFRNDNNRDYYQVICEDPEQKYNTQVKDYTIWEKDKESASFTIENGKYRINYAAMYKIKGEL